MRRLFLGLAFAIGVVLAPLAMAHSALAGPSLVVDMRTGKVLSAEEPFHRWYPASLTKLMTVYVVFQAVKDGEITLRSPVTISKNAASEPPSKMGYPIGSVLTVDNAIKILMVKSANDVATAVAESVAGSVNAFVARMNAEAQRLGMTGTHYVNAHGLHDPDHYTTARDLAVLTLHLRSEFPEYLDYFSVEAIGAGKVVIPNHNNLIGRFDGADGMKTGYTCDAGYNLVATATRSGRRLLAVVIGEKSVDDRDVKAAELLEKGFKQGGFDAPRLAALQPSGDNLAEATDMRPEICTPEARQERVKDREEEGDIVARSPYLHDFVRPRQVVMVKLGGATGPARPVYADVPVPTPRPDYTPPATVSAEGD